jgi:cell wall-associated NlpC family hydrolase
VKEITGIILARITHRGLPIMASALLAAACAGKVVVEQPSTARPAKPKQELAPMGFSIQVGAFQNVENAIRLTESLEKQGLSPYYFHHETGLYKVRFGDFSSKEGARIQAESLAASGVIDGYYIVSPEDYAAAKARIYGTAHLRNEIVETAERFIGIPYRWGGSSPDKGFDCSGLAMAVYQYNGLNLPRSSRAQFEAGTPVERRELDRGDLVFFSTSRVRRVSHVGVYTGEGRFVHAPGRGKAIRVNSLSDKYYAVRYVGARTYLE